MSSLILAILCLLRGNFIVWVPFHFMWIFFSTFSQKLKNIIINLFIFACVISPITYLNYIASGNFILITSQGGQNFYTGNNPENSTGYYIPLSFVRPSALYEESDFKKEAEVRTGKKLSPHEVSGFWCNESLKYFWNNPKVFITNLFKKTVIYFDWYEIPDNYDFYNIKDKSFIQYLTFLNFPLLWGFSFIAFLRLNTFEKKYLLILLLVYSASVICFFIYSRYRIPALFFLIIFASSGIEFLFDILRKKNYRTFIINLVLVILISANLSLNPFRMTVDKNAMKTIIEKRLKASKQNQNQQ
ncbi:MAG: hypothetical protein ACD_79C00918G0002 [uncultured bacterium]|nr:MAG: hypothetical protein ACD_79C00918G0002 [uncultured bacterium]